MTKNMEYAYKDLKGDYVKEKKPKKWWIPEVSGERIDIKHGAERIKHWLIKFIWRF